MLTKIKKNGRLVYGSGLGILSGGESGSKQREKLDV